MVQEGLTFEMLCHCVIQLTDYSLRAGLSMAHDYMPVNLSER